MRFEDFLNFGKVAESEITRWLLHEKEYSVLPVYELIIETGKGPRLLSLPKDLVVPDMLAMKENDARWIESKRKTHFAWYRRQEAWNTGIDLRHYLDYLEVEKKTGIPVWLFFLHEEAIPSASDIKWGSPSQCPTGLFAAPLWWLKVNESCRDSYTNGYRAFPMVYWNVDVLRHLASLEEIKRFSFS